MQLYTLKLYSNMSYPIYKKSSSKSSNESSLLSWLSHTSSSPPHKLIMLVCIKIMGKAFAWWSTPPFYTRTPNKLKSSLWSTW